MKPASTPFSSPVKSKFTLKSKSSNSYNFIISNEEEDLFITLESLKDFPIRVYELKTSFKELQESDENFYVFRNTERLINGVESCIKADKYSLEYNEEENNMILEIKNEFFENGSVYIKIHEKEQDLKTQVNCLTKVVAELRSELKSLKFDKKTKDETAINSFNGTSFLNNDEKKLISKFIHPHKIIKFNLLFSTNKDGDNSSTFHYYCDGIFPTVTVVLDTSGRRFGGYSTQNWCQSTVGSNHSRAPGSFIFNLANKKKYDLVEFKTDAVYRHNSYGPTFGGGNDLYLANSCKSNNNSYCSKSSYNSGNTNILGGSSSTNFQVSNYEVYQVVFE